MLFAYRSRLILSALLAAAVLAVYAPVAHYDFIALDDADYVKNNEFINHGFSWAGIKWSFENIVAGNWHPITMLSHMADCQVFGLSSGSQHLTNMLFHVTNTLLLFWLLSALSGQAKGSGARLPRDGAATAREPAGQRSRGGKQAEIKVGALANAGDDFQSPTSNLWPCALAAALFGLHPLHVESVAWISERKDVLSAFFALLTLLCYSKYVERLRLQKPGAKLFYGLAILLFALGLMSKSMLVTLPFVMLLLDFWPLQRFILSSRRTSFQTVPLDLKKRRLFSGKTAGTLLIEKLPFFLMAAIFSVITFLVQKHAGAVVALKYFPIQARLANAMVAYGHYLEKTFWPSSLAMLYPYQQWTPGQITISTTLFIGLSLLAIWAAPRRQYIFVGWFWFAGMLVPVIGLVQVGLQAMADHYTYLPLIGIFMALAWGLQDLAHRVAVSDAVRKSAAAGHLTNSKSATRNQQFRPRALFASVAILAVVPLAIASANQVRYWQNSETLFTHAVRATGHNTVARYILGALYDSQGKTDKAEAEFRASIEDDPGNVKALCGLGYILWNEGKLDEARQQYQAALRIAPDSAQANFGLAEVFKKEGNFDQAMAGYYLALQYNPAIPEAHYQLAALFSAKGDAASAISQLEEAVQLAPDWPLALNNLAWMRATETNSTLRNGAEAARLARRAVSLTRKDDPSTLDTLAAAYAETGRFPDATATAKAALETASAADETNLVKEIQSRLKLYQSHRPYRE